MSYNETGTRKKRNIAHPWVFRGTASAPFVPAQGLRAHVNSLSPHPRPLSTAVLARTMASYRSTMPLQVQSHRMSTALGILPLLCWSQRSPATLAPCLSRHGQQAATLLRKGDSSVVCILTILLFLLIL